MRIGIIGSNNYEKLSVIKDTIYLIHSKYNLNNIQVISRGNKSQSEETIKKLSIQYGISYKEFNAPHTSRNIYSVLPEKFYNLEYSPKNYFMRDGMFAKYVDKCICFATKQDLNIDKSIINCIGLLEKRGKQVTIIE